MPCTSLAAQQLMNAGFCAALTDLYTPEQPLSIGSATATLPLQTGPSYDSAAQAMLSDTPSDVLGGTPVVAPRPTRAAAKATAAAKRLRLLALLNCINGISKGCGAALSPHMAAILPCLLAAVTDGLSSCGFEAASDSPAPTTSQQAQVSEVAELCHHLDSILAAAAAARKPISDSATASDPLPAQAAASAAPSSAASSSDEAEAQIKSEAAEDTDADAAATRTAAAADPPLLSGALEPLAELVQSLLAAVPPTPRAAAGAPQLSDAAAVLQLANRALVLAQWQSSGAPGEHPLPASAVAALMAPEGAVSEARTAADAGARKLDQMHQQPRNL